jgi:hypothetical protein
LKAFFSDGAHVEESFAYVANQQDFPGSPLTGDFFFNTTHQFKGSKIRGKVKSEV